MHVRALDDFLKTGSASQAGRHDIRAGDWINGWQQSFWLDPRIRAQIDWQVVHLSSMSSMDFPPWNLARIGVALCDELERFFDLLADRHPDRMPAFSTHGDTRAIAQDARARFAKYVP